MKQDKISNPDATRNVRIYPVALNLNSACKGIMCMQAFSYNGFIIFAIRPIKIDFSAFFPQRHSPRSSHALRELLFTEQDRSPVVVHARVSNCRTG